MKSSCVSRSAKESTTLTWKLCCHSQIRFCSSHEQRDFFHQGEMFSNAIMVSFCAVPLTHWGRNKMADISQTTTSNAILLNENIWISLKLSLKFVPKGRINNIPALVQIMAWRRPGDKPLSEAMMASFATHICVTRPQWVKPHWCLIWINLSDE